MSSEPTKSSLVNLHDACALANEAIDSTPTNPLGVVKTRELGAIVIALAKELAGKTVQGGASKHLSTSARGKIVNAALNNQFAILGRPYTLGDLARDIGLDGQQAMLSPSRIDRLPEDRFEMIHDLAGSSPAVSIAIRSSL